MPGNFVDCGVDEQGFTIGYSWPLKERPAVDSAGTDCYEWVLSLSVDPPTEVVLFRAYPTPSPTRIATVEAGRDPETGQLIAYEFEIEEVEVRPLFPGTMPRLQWRPLGRRQKIDPAFPLPDTALQRQCASCDPRGYCEYKTTAGCKPGMCLSKSIEMEVQTAVVCGTRPWDPNTPRSFR